MKTTATRVVRVLAATALAAAIVSHGAASHSPSLLAQSDPNQIVSPTAFNDLKWRNVGASRGGRVTGFAGVRQQPHTFYAGATGGGVWKTEDAGITWYPVGDGQITTGSIGSIDTMAMMVAVPSGVIGNNGNFCIAQSWGVDNAKREVIAYRSDYGWLRPCPRPVTSTSMSK